MPDPVTYLARIPELNSNVRFPAVPPDEAAKLFDELLTAGPETLIALVGTINERDWGEVEDGIAAFLEKYGEQPRHLEQLEAGFSHDLDNLVIAEDDRTNAISSIQCPPGGNRRQFSGRRRLRGPCTSEKHA